MTKLDGKTLLDALFFFLTCTFTDTKSISVAL